jgi:hypothetical protein
MKRVGRSTFRKLYWLPLLGIVIVMMMASLLSTVGRGTTLRPVRPFLLTSLSFVFWSWLIGGRWIAYYLVPLFVSTLTCPGCGEQIDAVNVWNCACGFRDCRERHILVKRCPKCGKGAGHIDCPRCSTTLLLW